MNYAMVNLKTDPQLKQAATAVAKELGVSLSAVLNNELRRLVAEKSVLLEYPEVPTPTTAARLAKSKKTIEKGDYYRFADNTEALTFLQAELKV